MSEVQVEQVRICPEVQGSFRLGGGGSWDWGHVQRLGEGPVQRPLYGMTDRAKKLKTLPSSLHWRVVKL